MAIVKSKIVESKDKSFKKINTKGKDIMKNKGNSSEIKKGKIIKKGKSVKKNEAEDKSVFAVTEKLLKNKKDNLNKKKIEQLKFKNESEEKLKESNETSGKCIEIENFFNNFDKSEFKNMKKKPQWFITKIRNVIEIYNNSINNYKQEDTLENGIIKTQNEKKLFRFFQKLSSTILKEDDINNIKYWYHTTKSEVKKTNIKEKESVLKITLLNRKLKAITKEITDNIFKTKQINTNEDGKKTEPPAWFDKEFSDLIKIRNKAKRQWKSNPTKENEAVFRIAFKNVKAELIKRKKSGFVTAEPYIDDKNADMTGGFKRKSFSKKNFNSNIKPNNFTPNTSKFKPNASSNKHIKFE